MKSGRFVPGIHLTMKPSAGCPIFARPFAQEPALSGVEGVGFHSRRPLGILSSDMTENQEASRRDGDFCGRAPTVGKRRLRIVGDIRSDLFLIPRVLADVF
jgi:hypothetical protein